MKTLSIRNVLAVVIVGVLIGTAYITNPALFNASKVEAGTGENVSGWAWSENIGWIGFNDTSIQGVCDANNNGFVDVSCGGLDTGATPWRSFGVSVDTTNKSTGGIGSFSGYAWSDNIGWVSFTSSDLTLCPSGSCSAQVDWSTGKVTGWARALSGKNDPQAGGWDGWIKLSKGALDTGPTYGVTISGNKFSGYAWGGGEDVAGVAGVVGWIDFGPTVSGVPIGVQVSAPPCTTATATSWGSCQPLTQCTGGGTQSLVVGIKVGLCTSGGTVTQGCTIATQTCTATSSASTKIKYRQF